MPQITKKQISFLRALAARLLPTDTYRSWLRETFPGKDWASVRAPSTKELTKQEASHGIQVLLRLDDREPSKPWTGRYYGAGQQGQRDAMITQGQADEISRLEMAMGWEGEPERLQGFIRKQIARPLPPNARVLVSSLTKGEATRIITGLRRFLDDDKEAA
jgi:hypothetical protein